MENDVYVKNAGNGVALLLSAEIIDTWEDGCLIRSEEALSTEAGKHYYVEEADQLVSVHFTHPHNASPQPPFDYPAQKDRSDVRRVPSLAGSK